MLAVRLHVLSGGKPSCSPTGCRCAPHITSCRVGMIGGRMLLDFFISARFQGGPCHNCSTIGHVTSGKCVWPPGRPISCNPACMGPVVGRLSGASLVLSKLLLHAGGRCTIYKRFGWLWQRCNITGALCCWYPARECADAVLCCSWHNCNHRRNVDTAAFATMARPCSER